MKLFAVLLGGRAEGCNTELHDVVFTVGNSLEETYPKLVNKWFGTHKRLHIDSFVELKFVDEHEICINQNKPEIINNKKIFFVNYGGYKPEYFGEVHEVNFYVASSKQEVLDKAKKDLGTTLFQPHCDDSLLVDDIFSIEEVDEFYIHLQPTTEKSQMNIQSNYIRLDVPDIIEKSKYGEEQVGKKAMANSNS